MSNNNESRGKRSASVVWLDRENARHAQHDVQREELARDSSGYVVFSHGDIGAAHVMAHRMLDSGRIEEGCQQLGGWLAGRTGSGSDWVHLQFHMGVFELGVGDWSAAYTRFVDEILPSAAETEDALTDAPALLWRLALSAPEPVTLPWSPLRRTALIRMRRHSNPFVELHNLLALAGAGDATGIARWLQANPGTFASRPLRLLRSMAVALQAYASGAYRQAALRLHDLVPQLPLIGGSRAQNELFAQIEERSRWLANGGGYMPAHSRAA
jgi:signal transduction histidine kinase